MRTQFQCDRGFRDSNLFTVSDTVVSKSMLRCAIYEWIKQTYVMFVLLVYILIISDRDSLARITRIRLRLVFTIYFFFFSRSTYPLIAHLDADDGI